MKEEVVLVDGVPRYKLKDCKLYGYNNGVLKNLSSFNKNDPPLNKGMVFENSKKDFLKKFIDLVLRNENYMQIVDTEDQGSGENLIELKTKSTYYKLVQRNRGDTEQFREEFEKLLGEVEDFMRAHSHLWKRGEELLFDMLPDTDYLQKLLDTNSKVFLKDRERRDMARLLYTVLEEKISKGYMVTSNLVSNMLPKKPIKKDTGIETVREDSKFVETREART